MLLNEGELDGVRLHSRDAVKAMRTIATGDLAAGFVPGSGWGIGCGVVRESSGITTGLSPGSLVTGELTERKLGSIRKEAIYILMIQRSNIGNSDGSELRRALQDEANVWTAQGCFAVKLKPTVCCSKADLPQRRT